MAGKTLQEISDAIRKIDFAMLSTKTEGGQIAARPMSNNGDVEYDGDSWFFALEETRTVQDIRDDPKVALSFAGNKGLLGKPGMFIAVAGQAELVRDRGLFEAHWNSDIERYFPDGIDTAGLLLIKVHASRIHYWDGEDEGEVRV